MPLPTFEQIVQVSQWFLLGYSIALNGTYMILTAISLGVLPRFIRKQTIHHFPKPKIGFEPPISLIVTAFNEESVIIPTVKALLQLDYPEFEIIVVNDGSTDKSIEVLTKEFDLVNVPVAFRKQVEHKPIRGILQSRKYSNLRIVDKENGGSKADASNAGINACRFGLFMPLDADTILDRQCLTLMVQPFLLNPETIGVGGNVRVLNGCSVDGGNLTHIGLPKTWLGLFQLLEYTRAFLTSRVGWSAMNSLPLISGAFGLFKKTAVVTVGGYDHKSLGEDMDLVLRLHRHYRLKRIPYRIDFVADPVCWTEVPETFSILRKQRVRWQRGLFDCLWANRKLLFHPRAGGVGWMAFPFLLFLEGISPVIEFGGIPLVIGCYFLGLINTEGALAFLTLSFGTGFLLSVGSLLLEETAFRTYPAKRDLWIILLGAFLENFGYRQLNSFWRLEGMVKWLLRTKSSWGAMTRNASWAAPADNLSKSEPNKSLQPEPAKSPEIGKQPIRKPKRKQIA
jgi:cellulose synthase/poly-beta-1,6-N-acetylglucosamine synthase-like glycosyltransferase